MNGKYDFKEVEKDKAFGWRESNCFNAGDETKEPFSIVIPPPNITSKLHIGHAYNLTLQDIIIRYKRMCGYDAMWLAGMDHAGIATQAKVDERLKEQGTSRHEIGREKFLDEAWKWKDEHDELIREQWDKLGLSLDYSREKFTLDKDLSSTVSKTFIDMYNNGLIYRGEQIINWDPQAKTALSNIEVVHKDVEGAEHYFKYVSVDNSDDYLEIMTTRPETMFGDGALAVHPDDTRYTHLVGKEYIIPNTTTSIPVIQDSYVDMEKGSGVVKITMAHDPNDFMVAKRHNMEPRIIMNLDATMCDNEYVPMQFRGLTRYEARKLQIEECEKSDLLVKIEKITHSVGHSERTGVVVEPMLSKQWFVKMDSLAQNALLNQGTDDKVNFYPKRFEKIFTNWMSEVYDWCISRQIWWGHRIPAWYKDDEVYVGEECPGSGWKQDEDVLDTWFSSALWPFSTLGYGTDDLDDFNRYFPTSTLVTGYDIIFFWVSRMIFQSLHFTKKAPFKDVLITGLIRDASGRKMSKSLGNGIDPIELCDKYGTDAVRWYLITAAGVGMDFNYQEEKVESSWNFINKIWNASRYVNMQLGDDFKYTGINYDLLTSSDNWILSKYNILLEEINRNMDKYEFVVVGNVLYDFVWNVFCNWYLELSKIQLQNDDMTVVENTKNILYYMLDNTLKMLHPFMPFVTEEIYNTLISKDMLALNAWPVVDINTTTDDKTLDTVIDLITFIRNLRVEKKLGNKKDFPIIIETKNVDSLSLQTDILKRFMNVSSIDIVTEFNTEEETITHTNEVAKMHVIASDIVDKEEELERLQSEKKKIIGEIKRAEGMLSNSNFIDKAPKEKVDAEKEKLEKYKTILLEIENQLK